MTNNAAKMIEFATDLDARMFDPYQETSPGKYKASLSPRMFSNC
jgi:hypothetical protein